VSTTRGAHTCHKRAQQADIVALAENTRSVAPVRTMDGFEAHSQGHTQKSGDW
jgi:hypothetical protein